MCVLNLGYCVVWLPHGVINDNIVSGRPIVNPMTREHPDMQTTRIITDDQTLCLTVSGKTGYNCVRNDASADSKISHFLAIPNFLNIANAVKRSDAIIS